MTASKIRRDFIKLQSYMDVTVQRSNIQASVPAPHPQIRSRRPTLVYHYESCRNTPMCRRATESTSDPLPCIHENAVEAMGDLPLRIA